MLEGIINTKVKIGIFNKSSVRHLKKSGELIFADVEGNSITYENKEARLVLVVDVTKKLKAEQALEASERRFKALVQEGSDLIAILDTAGNYQYVSPTSRSILGLEATYFIGKNAFDFIHEEDKAGVIGQFGLLSVQKCVKITPFRFKDSNNRYRWIETIITNMADDPAVGGIVANSRDVTPRIENEIKTRESIDRFNTVSKATSDAIYDWDLLTNKFEWNKGIKGIFGHKPGGSCTLNWWYNQIHPNDLERVVKKVRLQIQTKKSRWKDEYRFRCADGSYKFVLDRGFLLLNENKQPVRMIGAMQDITERVNYIKAIEEQNLRLRQIAWTQSHVVRAPLSRIMGLSNLLCNYDTDEAIRKELLPHLNNSAKELDDIIRDIVKKTEEI